MSGSKPAKIDEATKREVAAIRASGLLLPEWYLARRPQAAGIDPVLEFCLHGWREGAAPNPYFNAEFYLRENQDVANAGFNPLWHFALYGEFEDRDPGPFFDLAWYRTTYAISPRESALKHFLERRFNGQVSPVPIFDPAYYFENNPDVAAGKSDPFEHFLVFGAAEGRNPAADFDVKFYLNRYRTLLGGQNPLLHYLANRDTGKFFPALPPHESLIPGAVRLATRPSPFFEEFQPLPAEAKPQIKLLAYYLPQFHRVAENEAWWGKGFTDWTNLGRALPRFAGHLQPRIPRDLGYYALDDLTTLPRQIALAQGAGLGGFVFYFYWFNRHRLLDAPLQQFLDNAALDFQFCVMWANENWTRRWDGMEREVLIAQEYRERDDEALVASFADLFADRRYIRVQGRPLLKIYRIDLIPNAAARLARWRKLFQENHGENPLIIMAQSLGDYDPTPYGLDGAVEFPPHKLSQDAEKINESLDYFDPDCSAAIFEYQDIADISLKLPAPDYPLIKTIVTGWDNDPRREGKGLVLHRATPDKYQAWLKGLVDYTARHDFYGERIVCVNAWNEWAEGAFLEPDLHFGAALLNATGRALCPEIDSAAGRPGSILLVGHDAQPHGAQLMLLHLARHLRRQHGMDVHLLLLGVGPLLGAYYEAATVTVAYDRTIIGHHLDQFRKLGIRRAIVNSAASARVVPWLAARGIGATLLVHEMPQILREYNLEIHAQLGGKAAERVVFSSQYVKHAFCQAVGISGDNAVILPQGNYKNVNFDPAARQRIRGALGVKETGFIVLGVGFGDLRKGFDLFVQLCGRVAKEKSHVHFVWAGDIQPALLAYLGPEMEKLKAAGLFHHIAFTDAVQDYFSAADVYALTSREDPYPTTVLEALSCGMKCVAFDETGGIPAMLRAHKAGQVVALGDLDAFQAGLISLLNHRHLTTERPRLAAIATALFSFSEYTENLLHIACPNLQSISVAVLNYNYERYLPARLQSIFAQSYPVKEILFFDDASTDDSVSMAAIVAAEAQRDMRLFVNNKNTGSAFAQWQRAATLAGGDYIWFAEADDQCAPQFLEQLANALYEAKNNVLLAFTDSKAIDDTGAPIMTSYKPYYLESNARELTLSGIWDGKEFARRFLSERNLIPNVSGVLWNRPALLDALKSCGDLSRWKIAGDWRLYLELLTKQTGSVVYLSAPLNTHRRHAEGMTQKLDAATHVQEIAKMHHNAAREFSLDAKSRKAQEIYLALVASHLGSGGKLAQGSRKTKQKTSRPATSRSKTPRIARVKKL